MDNLSRFLEMLLVVAVMITGTVGAFHLTAAILDYLDNWSPE